MDPVSAIGSAGAVVGLIDVATRTLSYLRTLQQQWKLADLTLNLLIGQLSTLNAALDQISQWISTSLPFDQQHHQLVMDLGNALESCKALLICIDDHISALRWNENESLTFQSKARAILRDQNMKDLLNHLNNQSGALNLLLTALNCRTLSEQKSLLETDRSREIIDKVKDDSSSLLCRRDSASFETRHTATTDTSSRLSEIFIFDRELLNSKVYQGQVRSMIKRILRKTPPKEDPDASGPSKVRMPPPGSPEWEAWNHSRMIDQYLDQETRKQRREVPLLLLGAPDSGKSTLLEMMRTGNEAYTKVERSRHKATIIAMVHRGLCAIIESMSDANYPWDSRDNADHLEILRRYPSSITPEKLPSDLATALAVLGKEPLVRTFCSESDRTAHNIAMEFFVMSIDRILKPDYQPTSQDIAQCLAATNKSNTEEVSIDVGDLNYHVTSRNAMGSELYKLLPCFDGVLAIIFIVDVSNYDEELENSLQEVLPEFDRICNSSWCKRASVVLLLNKQEALQENLVSRPLSDAFPEYSGGSDYQAALKFLRDRFLLNVLQSGSRHYDFHFISNTAWHSCTRFIRDAVRDTIVQRALDKYVL